MVAMSLTMFPLYRIGFAPFQFWKRISSVFPLGPICAVSFYVSDSFGNGPLSKVVRLVSDSFCAVSFVMETHLSDTKVGPKPRIHNFFFVSIATMLTYNSILILILFLLLYLLRNF